MRILVEIDAATEVPKEVADVAAAREYAARGFRVTVLMLDGGYMALDAYEAQQQADPPAGFGAEPEPEPAEQPKPSLGQTLLGWLGFRKD